MDAKILAFRSRLNTLREMGMLKNTISEIDEYVLKLYPAS